MKKKKQINFYLNLQILIIKKKNITVSKAII